MSGTSSGRIKNARPFSAISSSASSSSSTSFKPTTYAQLKQAVDAHADAFRNGTLSSFHLPPINEWDVSAITKMNNLFENYSEFNENIEDWDVSNVTAMQAMFAGCMAFNQPLNNWDVSNVQDMTEMFAACTAFNQPLDQWRTSRLASVEYMFSDCDSFNQSINTWNVSRCDSLRSMFYGCTAFNQPLDQWDVSNVTCFISTFAGCTAFNQPLNSWNVANAVEMERMFVGCASFNQPLSNWNLRQLSTASNMFEGCTAFNQPLNNWNMEFVVDAAHMFKGCTSFNQPLHSWTSAFACTYSMFEDCVAFNQPLDQWNMSRVVTTTNMFSGCTAFNQPLNSWKFNQLTTSEQMFKNCTSFNQPLDQWNMSNVTSILGMFAGCTSFNQPLNNWQFKVLESMPEAFAGCTSFNQPLDQWNVQTVINTIRTFIGCTAFNQPLNAWNVQKMVLMDEMFKGCTSFNQPLDNWKLTKVKSVTDMFANAVSMRQTLDAWIPYLSAPKVETVGFKRNSPLVIHMPNLLDSDPHVAAILSDVQAITRQPSIRQHIRHDKLVYPNLFTENDADHPYRIHYESFQSQWYPVISILKGTVLFTCREKTNAIPNAVPLHPRSTVIDASQTNIYESFFYLYKLANRPSFDHYTTTSSFENELTYFFPYPYMATVVNYAFERLDAVVLTKDVRLLCLTSPSPYTRAFKNDVAKVYDETGAPISTADRAFAACEQKSYDLCISPAMMKQLKLNGFIGIANLDSVSHHEKDLIRKLKTQSAYIRSILFRSCMFNNHHYAYADLPHRLRAVASNTNRVYGTPEIVLVPLDFHNCTAQEYSALYTTYLTKQKQSPLPTVIAEEDTRHFIFKPLFACIAEETEPLVQMAFDTISKYTQLRKSLQAYPLFNLHLPDVDPANHRFVWTYGTGEPEDNISFMNTYKNPYDPRYMCAFELMNMYVDRHERPQRYASAPLPLPPSPPPPQKGGHILGRAYAPTHATSLAPLPSTKYASASASTISVPLSKPTPTATPTHSRPASSSYFFYKEVNGIPIFAYTFPSQHLDSKRSRAPRRSATVGGATIGRRRSRRHTRQKKPPLHRRSHFRRRRRPYGVRKSRKRREKSRTFTRRPRRR